MTLFGRSCHFVESRLERPIPFFNKISLEESLATLNTDIIHRNTGEYLVKFLNGPRASPCTALVQSIDFLDSVSTQ